MSSGQHDGHQEVPEGQEAVREPGAPQCLGGHTAWARGDTAWARPRPTLSPGVHPGPQPPDHVSPHSYANVYRELEQTIRLSDAQEDLRWFRSTSGPGMPMNWPQFEVRLGALAGCWQPRGAAGHSGDGHSVLAGVEPGPDAHDNTEGEAEEGRGGGPDQRRQRGRHGGSGRRAREVRAGTEGRCHERHGLCLC